MLTDERNKVKRNYSKDVAAAREHLENFEIPDPLIAAETKTDKKKKLRSRIIWIAVFVAVNAAVISYTAVTEFSNRPPEELSFTFGLSNWALLFAGICCMLLALALESFKYIVMMRNLNQKVSPKAAFQTAALGKYYDNITPSGIGGQPFQIYNMHTMGYSNGVSAAMPLTSFLTMQIGFVILAIIVMVFKPNVIEGLVGIKIVAIIGVICYMIVPAAIILFTISQKTATKLICGIVHLGAKIHLIKKPDETISSIMKSVTEYHDSIIMMSRKKWLLVKLLAMSLLYQLAISSIPFFVLLAYNGSASYIDTVAMTVYIYCAITVIPTPGNAGAAEGSFYLIFSQLDPTGLFWSMLVWRVICYYGFIVIGIGIYGYNMLSARKAAKSKARIKATDPDFDHTKNRKQRQYN